MGTIRVYNIQKYSLHDGPGIRTTVFLKGCPLQCLWCHNPEGISPEKEIIFNAEKCLECGACLIACSHKLEDCQRCGVCAEVCPTSARRLAGQDYSVKELFDLIMADRAFYESSGGGVTFSGGEPLMQAEAILPLLEKLKANGLHITVDTSGYVPYDKILLISPYVDLWLYDIKHIDSARHRELTGVENILILDNLRKLATTGANILLRYPFIPNCNTEDGLMHKTAEWIVENIPQREICLLPYHNLAEDKHSRLNYTYELKGLVPPTEAELDNAREILQKYGLQVRIGG